MDKLLIQTVDKMLIIFGITFAWRKISVDKILTWNRTGEKRQFFDGASKF